MDEVFTKEDYNRGYKEQIITQVCEKHGSYQAVKQTFCRGFSHVSITECEGCLEDKRLQEEDKKRQENIRRRQGRIENYLLTARIPLRFADATFDTFIEDSPKIADKKMKCMNYASTYSKGASLILYGNTGNGKTHLGISILKQSIETHATKGIYVRAGKMIDEVKETYNKSAARKKQEVIESFTSPDLLVLDEIGVQHGSDTEKMILFEILNERYENIKSTVIIGNLDLPGLTEFIGERIIDRMKENGGMAISFDWQSRRK